MGIITFIELSIFLVIMLLVGIFIRIGKALVILEFLKKDAQLKVLLDLDIPGVILDKVKGLNEKLETFNDEKEEPKTSA